VGLAQPKMGASATQRCVTLGVHPPCRSPFAPLARRSTLYRPAGDGSQRLLPGPVSKGDAPPGAPRATRQRASPVLSVLVLSVLQCRPFCGKKNVAALREPQNFFTNLLTRMMVEIT
jgi:hypothetical protein